MEPQTLQNRDEQFVWPWMGVLVNVPTEWKNGHQIGESGNQLKEQLSHFCPHKVIPLLNNSGHTGNAIIEFAKDWTGFKNALAFENQFEKEGFGKKEWRGKKYQGSEMFGWVARVGDHISHGPIGDYLRKNGDLKTVGDFEEEGTRKTKELVANLAKQIEDKNRYLQELECKCNKTAVSLETMMEQSEQLFQSCNEEIRKMQQHARRHSQRIIDENQKLRSELESKMQELNSRSKQLEELTAQSQSDRRNLEKEEEKNFARCSNMLVDIQRSTNENQKHRSELESKMLELDSRSKQLDELTAQSHSDRWNLKKEKEKKETKTKRLQLVTKEQQSVDENLLKLLEEHKSEKQAAVDKVLKLEQQLNAKKMLELEIKQLKGKHIPGEDSESRKKIDELSEELQKKCDEIHAMKLLNQTLVIKERKSNEDMQHARKLLIDGFGTELCNYKEDGEATLKEVIQSVLKQLQTYKRKR